MNNKYLTVEQLTKDIQDTITPQKKRMPKAEIMNRMLELQRQKNTQQQPQQPITKQMLQAAKPAQQPVQTLPTNPTIKTTK